MLVKTEEKFSKEKKSGKKSDKLKEKIDVSQKKVAVSRNEYYLSLSNLNSIRQRYFQKEVDALITESDTNYHATLTDALDAYNKLNVQCDQNSMDASSMLDSIVEALDAKTDKTTYLRENMALFQEPAEFGFVPGLSDGSNTLDNSDSARDPLAQRYRLAAGRVHEAETEIKKAEAAVDETCSAKEAPHNVGSLAVDGKEKTPADWAAIFAEQTGQRTLSAFKRSGALEEVRILEDFLKAAPPDAGFKFSRANDLDWNSPAATVLKRSLRISKISNAEYSETAGLLKQRRSTHTLVGPQKHLMFGATLVECAAGSGLKVPKIVDSCIKALSGESQMREEGIFRVPGGNAEITTMRSAFESNKDPLADGPGSHDTNAIAGLLKWYLRELGDPVMTTTNYSAWLAIDKLAGDDAKIRVARDILANKMPPEHSAVLSVLFPFLNAVSKHADVNKMGNDNIATVFGPTLLQASKDDIEAIMRDQSSVNRVTRFLLTNQDKLFVEQSAAAPQAVAAVETRDAPPSARPRGASAAKKVATPDEATDAVTPLRRPKKNPLSEILHASTKPASRPVSMAVPDHTMSIKFSVRAKYDYNARSDQELTFLAGQEIAVYDEIDANWYEGAKEDGKLGCVAVAYVEVITKDSLNTSLPDVDYLSRSVDDGDDDSYLNVNNKADGEYLKVEPGNDDVDTMFNEPPADAPEDGNIVSPVIYGDAAAAAGGDEPPGDKAPVPDAQAKPKPTPRTSTSEAKVPPAVPPSKPAKANSSAKPMPPTPSNKPKLQPSSTTSDDFGSATSSRTNSFTKVPSGPPPSGPPPSADNAPAVNIEPDSDDDDHVPPPPPSDHAEASASTASAHNAGEASDSVPETLLVQRRASVGGKKDRPVSVGPSFAPPAPPGFAPPPIPTEEPEVAPTPAVEGQEPSMPPPGPPSKASLDLTTDKPDYGDGDDDDDDSDLDV